MKKFLTLALFTILYGVIGWAANGPSVGVSSITLGTGTITVNTASTTNLTAGEGVCLTAPASYCGTISTINTGTQFVMPASGVAACAAACGTVSRAPKIIWLSTQAVSGGYNVNYVLWLTTTMPVPGSNSSAWTSATTAENSAISAGYFIERNRQVFFPTSTTLANAEAQFQNDYTAQQNALSTSVQPGQFYGNYYDGSGWTQ